MPLLRIRLEHISRRALPSSVDVQLEEGQGLIVANFGGNQIFHLTKHHLCLYHSAAAFPI